MSDLKDLAWSVQQQVEPPPFDQLQRRAVRRRHRKHLLVTATVAAATVAAVLSTLFPSEGRPTPDKPPVATPSVQTSAFTAEALNSAALVSLTRWSASWSDCRSRPCRYSAVISRDGKRTVAPTGSLPYTPLRVGNETILVAAPMGPDVTSDDPSWSSSVLLRSTARGPVQSVLRYADATSTYQAGEIVTNQLFGGRLVVLNLDESTLRPLIVPDLTSVDTTAEDGTGRRWVLGDTASSKSVLAWTDDGATWHRQDLDAEHTAAALAVSPDGRTIAAGVSTGSVTSTLMLSTDRGAHWTTMPAPVQASSPIAFDDGTAVLLGQPLNDPTPSLYGASGGRITFLNGLPDRLQELTRDGGLVYGVQIEYPGATHVVYSTDHGHTWTRFTPR